MLLLVSFALTEERIFLIINHVNKIKEITIVKFM